MIENAIVPKLQSGDPVAYEEMVYSNTSRMLRVARRMLESEEDARDAVQDAFMAAFRSIGNFESTSLLSTWLHRILVNACLMKLRTRRRKPEEDIERLLPRFLEDGHHAEAVIPWCESAETILQRTEMCGVVREAIEKLHETYRVVLLLRDMEEMSTEEVAAVLGTTANAVKIRLHRARQALRTLLDPYVRAGVQ